MVIPNLGESNTFWLSQVYNVATFRLAWNRLSLAFRRLAQPFVSFPSWTRKIPIVVGLERLPPRGNA